MPGISFRISLDGSEQVNKQLASVAKTAEQSFDSATAAVSKLGKTAEQAFATAAVAAKNFGASAADLQKVNSTIQAISDQAAASGIAYSKLARSFDNATGAFQASSGAFRGLGQAAAAAGSSFALSRREVSAFRLALRQLDLGAVGGQFAAFARIGTVLGGTEAAIFGVGGAVLAAGAALTKFAQSAAETAAALTKVQDVSGQSFENLSALQQVFAKGGTSAKEFGQTFTEIFQGISEASKTTQADVTESAAKAAQAEADAFRLRVQTGKAVGVQNEALLRQLDQRAAKARATAEENKALTEQANNLGEVINQFERLARGEEVALAPLTTMQTAVKALDNALANVGKQGQDQFQALANIIKGLPIGQARQLQQALKIPDTTFDALRKGGPAIAEATQQVQQLGTTLTQVDQQNLKSFTDSWKDMTATISASTQKIGAQAAPGLIEVLAAIKQSALDLASVPIGQNLANSLQGIGTVLKQVFVDSWVSIGSDAANSFMTNFIGPIMETFGVIGGAAQAAFASVVNAVSTATSVVAGFATQLASIAWDAVSSIGVSAWDAITGAINRAIQAILQFIGLRPSSGGGGGGDAGGLARGGLMGGRGTGTSDSNLAWLSRGEHVMPARAVRQPGVLAFLEMLRRSGGNLRGVLDGMGHFARGGLVLPAFAAGGPVGGMSNVTIQFPGLQPISGLRASASVVDELHRAAALAQVRSGGRKPSRYS